MLDAFSHVEVVFEALQCRLCDCSEQENMTQAFINQQLPRLISRTALSSSPERRKQSSVPAAAMLERLGVVPGGQPQGAWPAGLLVKAPTLSPLVTLSRQPKVRLSRSHSQPAKPRDMVQRCCLQAPGLFCGNGSPGQFPRCERGRKGVGGEIRREKGQTNMKSGWGRTEKGRDSSESSRPHSLQA